MTEDIEHEEIQPASPAIEFADAVHAALEAWRSKMILAATGRSATTVARMATARTAAELKRLQIPTGIDDGTVDYARRAAAAVGRAAHEIERNRYSLEALFAELERLDKIFRRVTGRPEPETESTSDDEPASAEVQTSGDAGGRADN